MSAQSGPDLLPTPHRGTAPSGTRPFPTTATVLAAKPPRRRGPADLPAQSRMAALVEALSISGQRAARTPVAEEVHGGPRRATLTRPQPVRRRALAAPRGIEPCLALTLSAGAALATMFPHLLTGSTPLLAVPAAAATGTAATLGPFRLSPDLLATLTVWLPAAVAAAVALLAALLPGRAIARTARGVALLGAAGMMLLTPSQVPLGALWVVAVAAAYPSFLPAVAARVLTALALLVPATPLVAHAARAIGTDPVGSLLSDIDPTATDGTLFLLGAMALAGVLGVGATATRRRLESQTSLAHRRGEDAERVALKLDRLSTEDAVTGLPNRAGLLRRLMLLLARADVAGGQVALLVIEVERFAELTDGYGGTAADDVIRHVARRLRAWHPATDLVARISDHRFAVLANGAGADTCTGLAERISELLDEPIVSGDRELSITCSIGIATSTPDLDTAEELLRAAEEAMHAAQRGGRSRWATFDGAMRAHTLTQAGLETELREAVRAGRIEVVFKPVMTLRTEGDADGDQDGVAGPVAVEAVPRWTRRDGTAVPPQRFLRIAEDLGLGTSLGLQVLDAALVAMAGWREAGAAVRQVWVDMLGSQLLDPEFPHMVSARLVAHRLPSSSLQLEVSTPGFLDSEQARCTLGMLRSLGIDLALEDFGREGTSLAALRHLPITVVKVDHQFSADLGRNEAILRGVVEMCHRLGLRTVLAGVETNVQVQAARRIGADAVQGMLLGRATTAEDLAGLLAVR
jgi:diguanylate cyclase (GGDEF)-like protein